MQRTDAQTLLWTIPQCPYRVTIPADVLAEINIAVVEGYHAVPRGGVEVGGVFFGLRDADSVHILTHHPTKCQYLSGPSFNLSDEDKSYFSGVVNLPMRDPQFAGMSAIGWYHSHTRSEIFLSDADLALYREFFPERWQIALVLRPAKLMPTRAGFFFYDPAGGIQSEGPLDEFIVQPPGFGLKRFEAEAETALPQAPAAIEDAVAAPPEPPPAPVVHETARIVAEPDSDEPREEPPAPRVRPWDQVRAQLADAASRHLEKIRPPQGWSHVVAFPRSDSNRRCADRESGDGLVAFYWEGGTPRAHQVRDISRQGAFVETDFAWPCGTLMILTLQIGSIAQHASSPLDSLVVQSEIVRVTPEGMGLKFTLHNFDELISLRRFLFRWNPETAIT